MGGWSEDRVYVYHGCDASELYGSRGTAPRSSSSALFDDYGRSIGLTKERGEGGGSAASPKVVRVMPKVETSEDVRNGVHKFRLKLLPEGAGSPMDVLCQVESIVLSIISMFSSPNDESPANIEAAKEWREKRDDFKKMDRCIVRKYQEML